MTYPKSAGFTAGSDTSEAAANDVSHSASAQCGILRQALSEFGDHGLTMDEATSVLANHGMVVIKNNVSARLGQLCGEDLAFRSKDRRPGKLSKRPQTVYKLKRYWTIFDRQPEKKDDSPIMWLLYDLEQKGWLRGVDIIVPNIVDAGQYSFDQADSVVRELGLDEIGVPKMLMRPFHDV